MTARRVTHPRVSVIVPARNAAPFLPAALASVRAQTLAAFEVIVVDDGSTDATADLVAANPDPRVRLLVHTRSRGASAARNTALAAARADLVAFLDADDLFHPEKLARHVALLDARPEIGASYNPRFNLRRASERIRDLWWPPAEVDLLDLVLGYPFAPSDLVVRTRWLRDVGGFDERYTFWGDDRVLYTRLALAGCRFARVDRTLNRRRYHGARSLPDLRGGLAAMLRALRSTFADRRCEHRVRSRRGEAYANVYLDWVVLTTREGRPGLARRCLRRAVAHDARLSEPDGARLADVAVAACAADDRPPEAVVTALRAALPANLTLDTESCVARATLQRVVQDVLWGTTDGPRRPPTRAAGRPPLDPRWPDTVAHQLGAYRVERGDAAADRIVRALGTALGPLLGPRATRAVVGTTTFNLALSRYRLGDYRRAFTTVLSAVRLDPRLLGNRGALALLARSPWRWLRATERRSASTSRPRPAGGLTPPRRRRPRAAS